MYFSSANLGRTVDLYLSHCKKHSVSPDFNEYVRFWQERSVETNHPILYFYMDGYKDTDVVLLKDIKKENREDFCQFMNDAFL